MHRQHQRDVHLGYGQAAAFGDRDAAFRKLERAADIHDPFVVDVGLDPIFDDLRDDPRMTRLMKRLGLS